MNDRAPESEIEELRNDAEAGRYEARLASGDVAVLDYQSLNGGVLFTHTETPPRHRNQGIAGELTRYALDDTIERGLKIAPQCPYTVWFIRENSEYKKHLAEGFRV
ncbi:MAG: GNAT family N-acetyltransferase [Gemmatimonadota bacterium]